MEVVKQCVVVAVLATLVVFGWNEAQAAIALSNDLPQLNQTGSRTVRLVFTCIVLAVVVALLAVAGALIANQSPWGWMGKIILAAVIVGSIPAILTLAGLPVPLLG